MADLKISQVGLNLIEAYEGFRSLPYLDAVNIPTIGIGTIRYPNEVKVSMQDKPISKEQAYEYLRHEVEKIIYPVVTKQVKVPITQNQFDAIVSFCYNCGVNAFAKSTLLKLLNQKNYQGAADEFLKWDKAGGKALAGLTKRRKAERQLFITTNTAKGLVFDKSLNLITIN